MREYAPYLAPRCAMKEVELGAQLHSLLRLPSALDNQSIMGIYFTCCACRRRIVESPLAISRLIQDSKDCNVFIKKANALVYRRSTFHEETCRWGIPTLKANLSKNEELVIVPQSRSRRELQLRRQILRIAQRS